MSEKVWPWGGVFERGLRAVGGQFTKNQRLKSVFRSVKQDDSSPDMNRWLARRVWFWAICTVTASVLKALLDWAFTYVQAIFLDSLSTRSQSSFSRAMSWIPGVLAAEAFLSWSTSVCRSRWTLTLRQQRAQLDGDYISDAALLAASGTSGDQDLVQSLVEDTKTEAELTALLASGLAGSLTMAAFFSVTLAITLPSINLWAFTIRFPMVLFAFLTFGISSLILHKIGSRLPEAETELARTEAVIRALPARVRENARAIGMLRGSAWEARAFQSAVSSVSGPLKVVAWLRGRLHAVGAFVGPSDLLVLLALSPLFFAGDITLGQLLQAGMAHRGVGMSLDWMVNHYADWARWQGARKRIRAWRLSAAQMRSDSLISYTNSSDFLSVRSLTLCAPSNKTAGIAQWKRKYDDIEVCEGQNTVLRAPSGFGKSVLFSALAGAWPWGDGSLVVPRGAVFIPQRPYYPRATLLEAICYPNLPSSTATVESETLLRAVGLSELASDIHREADWNSVLSGGEAARVGLVRALLARPTWLFLDEPTANLDQASANCYWHVLQSRPGITTVLITHGEHGLTNVAKQILITARDENAKGDDHATTLPPT